MIWLIRKELWENLKWALLAMVVLGAAELYALYPQDGQQEYYNYISGGVTITKTSFLTVTTFGSAISGFLLGLIQILPELKRDRWAALLHRPVSHGAIFRGKALAGLLLYTIAVVPPFLFCVWLVATPGYFPSPFVPEMVHPAVIDLGMGVVYYFAGLAVALLRGGWFGLRFLPFLAAFFISHAVINDERDFSVALERVLGMALAMSLAAGGEIANQGSLRARPWWAQAAFLAVIFYGVCGAVYLTKSYTFSLFPSAKRPNFLRYELTEEGVPIQITYSGSGVVLNIKDTDGKPLTEKKYQPDRVRNHLMYLNTFSETIGNSHGHNRSVYHPKYREAQAYLWANYPYMFPRTEQWFFLVKQNIMVGYLPEKKRSFAYLDQRGFEPATTSPLSFPSTVKLDDVAQDSYCVWDKNRAQFAVMPKQEMFDVTLPAPGPIYGLGTAWARTERGSVNVFGITLGTGMAVYDAKGKLITQLPYDRDMDHWGHLSLGVNGHLDRFYLRYDPSNWIDGKIQETMNSYVEELNLQGQVLHTYTLPPLPHFPNPRSWDSFLSQRLQSPGFYFGTMIYDEIGVFFGAKQLQGDLNGHFKSEKGWRETKEWSVYILSVSLFLAIVTLFWSRSAFFSWPRAWAWAGFVFLFNVVGIITFRLAADWPRMVACPSCAKKRPVEFEACPHCGKGWPAKPATGIEIFDRPHAEALTPAAV